MESLVWRGREGEGDVDLSVILLLIVTEITFHKKKTEIGLFCLYSLCSSQDSQWKSFSSLQVVISGKKISIFLDTFLCVFWTKYV